MSLDDLPANSGDSAADTVNRDIILEENRALQEGDSNLTIRKLCVRERDDCLQKNALL